MLPSFLSNMFWSKRQESWKDAAVEHTSSEEVGDWLLITTQKTPIECDGDSVCSDGSWVLTPSPAFHSSSLAPPSESSSHPLEDLLIEHPTMSVYGTRGSQENLNKQIDDAVSDTDNFNHTPPPPPPPPVENLNNQRSEEEIRLRNRQHHEIVLRQNRQRQQLATQLRIPLVNERSPQRSPPNYGALKPPQLSRKALRRHNVNNARQKGGKLHQRNRVQKCTFKAGRRRC